MGNPLAKLETSKGSITIELYPEHAPNTVENFISLVKKSFYDGLTFHRTIPGFIIQTGCPIGDGTGGPGYTIPCESQGKNISHDKPGVVAMAHGGKDTGGSQFYIALAPHPHLDGAYTIFGQVKEGLEAIHKIVAGDIVEKALILEDDLLADSEKEHIASEGRAVTESPDSKELEPMDEISQMMDRIKTALEVAGINTNSAENFQEDSQILSGKEAIIFPTSSKTETMEELVGSIDSAETTAIEELTSTTNSAEEISVGSRLEEAMLRSKGDSSDMEPQGAFQEADTVSKVSEEPAEVQSDEYTIGKIGGAMLGDIQELSDTFQDNGPTPADAAAAIHEQLEAVIEEQAPSSLDSPVTAVDLRTADEVIEAADETPIRGAIETMEDLRDADQTLQEAMVNLKALTRTSAQIAIALQLIGVILAGILAFEIVAM
ncbi:MAG: peptidylprolyl isomerase, partial [Candidatus Hodarchaeales archaeon]